MITALRWFGIALLVIATVAGAALTGYLINAGPVGAALSAKQLCSLVFVSGLDPQRARTLYLKTLLGPANRLFRIDVDRARQQVRVEGVGTGASANHYPGLGCVLGPAPAQLEQTITVRRPEPVGVDFALREQHFNGEALEAALDRAFAESEATGGVRNTLAVAVRFRDRIVAERYAPGISAATPLPGWSMAKSFTATLAGMLAADGRLDLDARELFPEWREPDLRAAITPDQLLRMLSGIDLDENGSGLDPNSRMLFLEPDSVAFARGRGLRASPGGRYAYTSGSTMLLQGYLTRLVGGPAPMQRLVRKLVDTLGMHSSVFEPDPAGTFVGSSFLLASAQDWTRLGQLYLNRGRWGERQLFDSDWVDYVSLPSKPSGDQVYGAGFRRAQPAGRYLAAGVPALPEETLSALGLQNQALYILPSAELVIVRLGATGRYWASGQWQLVADILAARRSTTREGGL